MKFDIRKMTDVHKLAISYLACVIIMQLVFFAENPVTVINTTSVLFWIFVLPGIGMTYLWKMGFLERFALSIAVGAATVGISSYYLGLVGVHVQVSSLVLPALFIAIGISVIFREKLDKLNLPVFRKKQKNEGKDAPEDAGHK